MVVSVPSLSWERQLSQLENYVSATRSTGQSATKTMTFSS